MTQKPPPPSSIPSPPKKRSYYNLDQLMKQWQKDAEKEPLDPMDQKPTDSSLRKAFGFPLSGSPDSGEDPMAAERVKLPKLPRVVHWRNGRWGVVAGPFPERFFRTETRDTWQKASKLYADTAAGRAATTRDDQFAKVRLEDILEIETENEWGPVSA